MRRAHGVSDAAACSSAEWEPFTEPLSRTSHVSFPFGRVVYSRLGCLTNVGLSETRHVNLCFSLGVSSHSVGELNVAPQLDVITTAGEEFISCTHLFNADLRTMRVDFWLAEVKQLFRSTFFAQDSLVFVKTCSEECQVV